MNKCELMIQPAFLGGIMIQISAQRSTLSAQAGRFAEDCQSNALLSAAH
jgi:hypothetical protein